MAGLAEWVGQRFGNPYEAQGLAGLVGPSQQTAAAKMALASLAGQLIAAGGRQDPGGPQQAIGQGLAQFVPQYYGNLADQGTSMAQMYRYNALAAQERAERAKQGRMAQVVGGYDPMTDIHWNSGRVGPQGVSLDNFTPTQRAVFQATPNPEDRLGMLATSAFSQPEPPATRTINLGGEEVTQEWTGSGWREIGRGARWKPETPGVGEPPTTREVKVGDQIETQQWTGDRWETVATAPRSTAGTGEPSLMGRLRWIAFTGQDPVTREKMDPKRALEVLAPGSQAKSREEFQLEMAAGAQRNFGDSNEAFDLAGRLWDRAHSGVQPASVETDSEEPSELSITRGIRDLLGLSDQAGAAPGGGVTIPIPPDLPTMAMELNTLPDAAKEARLRKLLAEDPEGFEALMRFLEGQ